MNVAVYMNVVLKKDPKGVAYLEETTSDNKTKRVDIYYDKKYHKLNRLADGTKIKMVAGTFVSEQPFCIIFSYAHTNMGNLEYGISLEEADDYGYDAPFLKIDKIKLEKRRKLAR